jgi:hypothetical protein
MTPSQIILIFGTFILVSSFLLKEITNTDNGGKAILWTLTLLLNTVIYIGLVSFILADKRDNKENPPETYKYEQVIIPADTLYKKVKN